MATAESGMSDPDRLRKLAWLISDSDQVDDIDPEEIPNLLGAMESVKIRLEKRYLATTTPTVEPVVEKGEDRLLTADETAERLRVKPKWLYDHFDQLPFGKRLADRTLRFSERGLNRWLERKVS
jgi:hypothetical protein